MDSSIYTGRIEIVKTPTGEAPKEIRQAWVGVFLPCLPIVSASLTEHGILSKCPVRPRFAFHVPQDAAIDALELAVPNAAKWWREKGFPRPNTLFNFGEDEARIIYGVIRQIIILTTPEMIDDPNT